MVAISSSKMQAAAPIRAVATPVRDELAGFVAHDLRSPLATLAMNLDFLLDELTLGAHVTADARSALEDCRGANVHALRMVCDMADALVLASGDRKPVLVEVDLGAVVAAVVERVAGEAKARHVAISSRVEPTLAQADVELITRVVERVVERALWLARCGGKVDIVLEVDTLAVTVSPPPARGASAGRSLGTYLAEVAMRVQGGALTMVVDDKTLTFDVRLPRPMRER
jgi:K+-sensing histidine kinase KdpD